MVFFHVINCFKIAIQTKNTQAKAESKISISEAGF